MTIHRIRVQLEVYHNDHSSTYPTLANLKAQLAGVTDHQGNTVPATTPGSYGPYLQLFPINPQTGTATVGSGAVGDSDWYYDENIGVFHANNSAESRLY